MRGGTDEPRARGGATEAIFTSIVGVWTRQMEKARNSEEQWHGFVGFSIGTLTVAKLLLRFSTEAPGEMAEGDIVELGVIEREADELAGNHFRAFAQALPDSDQAAQFRVPLERPFLQLVAGRGTFQWCPKPVGMDALLPFDERTLAAGGRVALEVMREIGALVFAPPLDEAGPESIERMLQRASELIPVVACVKVVLLLWGNDLRVCGHLEAVATELSKRRYAEVKAGTRSTL